MRRAGGLWPRVVDPANLLAAARAALRRKRFSESALRFAHDLEPELARLHRELVRGAWRPGAYRQFWIVDPKPRLISAAPFRDRVVHHALLRVLEPVLDARLAGPTFANRRGKGTHAALALARRHAARWPWVLRLDVTKFFPSIDHALLLGQVARLVKCGPTLALLARIVDGSPPQEAVEPVWFPGDDLFTPAERRRGLPIGNLTSQHLANVHLAGLDRLALDALAPGRGRGGYVRYMDDLLAFADDPGRLRALRAVLEAHLATLRLLPHPRKTFVQPTAAGVRFVGFDLWPARVRVAAPSLRRARRRLARLRDALRREADPDRRARLRAALALRAAAWVAHARHADAAGLTLAPSAPGAARGAARLTASR